ncbi:MAG: hypothetical protein ACOC01_00955 [Bacteroidales bacterium]
MRLVQKILAFVSMAALLVSTMGYTIEHHFCNHCERNFETAWFLVPGAEDNDHNCDCSHEDESEETCLNLCEVDRAVHVEHVQSDIQSFLVKDDGQNTISLQSIPLEIPPGLFFTGTNVKHLKVPEFLAENKPPDRDAPHILNCVFRL